MPKQLNVDLSFTADTSQAKAQLQDLQRQLSQLTSPTALGQHNLGVTQQIKEAIPLVAQLQAQLQSATNVNTGKLDLTKFNESLKQSNMNMNKYYQTLSSLGPAGDKAFVSLANSVMAADVPLKRVNAKLAEMKTVLANTVRWQISSSMLHGFMGAVSSAYGYAQDLNESLNNIRIVTGYNIEQMSKFADQANRAAKALSTTTTDYTNASLIYYQQGLSDSEVQQRTDVTIKMANVARQSATVVSDQLTAIWNNFYDGSKSLEYYADVMTALGAATASSTDEIAGGLEKFAAIGETIGLSYEYAASALATITSNTRQSEEVVGTALKTIFARIQGLNLGETLDDGVTLNKYSEALETVGISIFESNGELKEMDNILDELGAKWDTIGKAEQTALAQTVAGVRQYTQLIALMENWNNGDSDSMQANLETSYNASGALDKQADIYAESWEAAQDRVRAASEGVYQSIINDDFFIDLLNGFEKIISSIDNTIDALGGLPGVMSLAGGVLLKFFGKDLAAGIDNAIFGIRSLFGITKKETEKIKSDAANIVLEMNKGSDKAEYQAEGAVYSAQITAQQKLIKNASKLSEEDQQRLKIEMDIAKALGDQAIKSGQMADSVRQQAESKLTMAMAQNQNLNEDFQTNILTNGNFEGMNEGNANLQHFGNTLEELGKMRSATQALKNDFGSLTQPLEGGVKKTALTVKTELQKALNEAKSHVSNLKLINPEDAKAIENQFETIEGKIKNLHANADGTFDPTKEDVIEIKKLIEQLPDFLQGKASKLLSDATKGLGESAQNVREYGQGMYEAGQHTEDAARKTQNSEHIFDGIGNSADRAKAKIGSFGQVVSAVAQSITATISIFNAVKGAWETIQNPDLSGWEKFVAILGSVASTVPMAVMSFASLGKQLGITTKSIEAAGGGVAGFFKILSTGGGKIAIVIAAIAALSAVIVALINAYNADARAAEKAAKTAEQLAEANIKVKESYDKLKQSFNAYESAQKALDDLVEGTVEWKNQLQQVHNSVLDLIKAYPTLLQYNNAIQYDEKTGLIKGVDETYLQMAMEDASNDAAEANAAAIMGKATANQASLKSDTTNLSRTIGKQLSISSSSGIIDFGNLKGLSASGRGADMSRFLSTYSDDLANLDENAYKDKARELSKEFLQNNYNVTAETITDYEKVLSGFTDLLIDNQEEINKLGEAYGKANTEMDNAAKMIVSQEIADDLQEMKKQDRNAVSEATSEMYEAEVEALEKDYKKLLSGKGNADGDYKFDRNARYETLDGSVQQIIDKFQEIYNLTNADQDSNFIRGGKDNREYYWNTEQFENGVSADFIAQTVAAAKALENCGVNANKVAAALAHVDEQLKAVENADTAAGMGEGVRGFIAEGNFETLNQKEYEAMVSEQFAGKDGIYNQEELKEFLGLSPEEIVKAFGVENIEEALDKWNNALNDVPETLRNVSDTLSKTPKMYFDDLDNKEIFSDMSVKTKKNMADMFQSVFHEDGVLGLGVLHNLLEGLGKDADLFAEHIDGIDWNTVTIDSLTEQLQALGITIDEDARPQLNYLIEIMKTASKIDLRSATKKFKEYQDKANSIKAGDIVEDEDYSQMIKDNPILAQYFTKTIGGYMMTDTTGNFASAAEQTGSNAYALAINGLKQDIAMYQAALKQNYDSLIGNSATGFLTTDMFGFSKYDTVTSDTEKAKDQLNYLQAAGYDGVDQETMDEWQAKIDTDTLDYETAIQMADAIKECGDSTDYFNESLDQTKKNLEEAQEAMSFADYTDQINDLGLEFEFTESYADALAEQMIDSKAEYDNLELASRNLAIANQRLDRGIQDLSSNLDNYQKALAESNKGTVEYQKALEDLKTNIADIFNTDKDLISNDFIEKQLLGDPKKLKEVANGNMKIINSLRKDLAKNTLEQKIKVRIEDKKELARFEKAFAEFEKNFPDLEVGAFVSPEAEAAFINSLNQMIAAAGMTKDEVNALLGSMGMSAKINTTYVDQEVDVPEYTTHEKIVPTGTMQLTAVEGAPPMTAYTYDRITTTVQSGVKKMMGQVPVVSLETISEDGTSSGGGIDILTNKAGSSAPSLKPSGGSSGGGGGGGGGDSQPAEPIKLTKHSDIVDRYKEVDDTLDNVRDAFEDVEKITDRLYGVSHISGLKYQNKLLQQEIGLLKDKVKEAKAYLAVDKQELANAAAKAGVSVQFGVEGDITNYTASMNKLFDELHAAEVYWNNTYHGKTQEDQQKYQEEVLDPIKEKIDDFKDAVSQYDETKELIEDLQNEIDDKFYEWQDNNYETLHYKLEFEIELNDLQLTELEYYLKKLEDDFYSLAEAGQYMSDQIPVWLESLGFHEDFYKGMDGTVDLKQISQLNFVEGTMESIEAIYETLQELNDLDKAMKEYYGKTLEMANEELEGHIDHLEHLTDVLDHYKNIVTMINGEMDYDRIGTILQGYADSIASELDVLQARYQMLQTEKEAIQTSYNNAANEAEKEIFREELEAITKAVDEAQADMLDKTEDWADAMKAVMENTIAAAGKELEDAFTFNMGFDSLSSSLDRLSSFHEEYLTKANQIYETQKLMRKAQQDADKTENQASKIKLKSFIDETQQLQNKTQMSKLDLEIQQAKYDLLLAQIALEDAQNAKSTVRLQRDNEGNFGYVYTADQEMIGEKEQELADAENALYNIGLEAANDYGNKRLELQQQLADELVTLNERRNNGEFETDALYYAERDRIIAEYTNLFTAYSNQYTTALGVDAQIQRDSWIQAYSEMIDNTLLWKDKTTEYLGNCEDAYDEWRNAVVEKGEIINDVLTNTSSNVEKLTNESKELATELQDNLIPLINQELVAVRNITSAYAALREELQKIIEHYEELAAQMRDKVEEEAYKDRFEYTREFDAIGEITGAAGQSFEEALAAEKVEPGERKKGYASVWNANTNQFEVMDEKQLADYYESIFWLQGRDQNLTGKQIRELAENYTQAVLLDEEDLEKALSGKDENWGNLITSGYYDDEKGEYISGDKITVENLAQALNATQNALVHGASGEDYGKLMSDITGDVGDSVKEKYNNYLETITNANKNGASVQALSYLEWLDEQTGAGEWKKQYNAYAEAMKATGQKAMSMADFIDAEKARRAEEKRRADMAAAQAANKAYHESETGRYYDQIVEDLNEEAKPYRDIITSNADAKTKLEAIKKEDERRTEKYSQAEKDSYNAYAAAMRGMNQQPMSMKDYIGYDTGGIADFTGPAWLDGTKQKPELVLNPDDTKNFLAATDMLRTISQTIDLQAMASQVNLNTPPGLFNEYDRALEQMVHIEASFPAVQDRNEIEAAFNNLINTAAQYANRKY